MNDSDFQKFRELAWRRPLTRDELAKVREHLAEHPEARADWHAEASLSQLLEKLPEAPTVSTNFTSQIMQAIERDKSATSRAHASGSVFAWLGRNWMPRFAVAGVAAAVAVISVHQYQSSARAKMAIQVAGFADAVSASGTDVLENFDSIYRLSDSPPKADTDLIALMK